MQCSKLKHRSNFRIGFFFFFFSKKTFQDSPPPQSFGRAAWNLWAGWLRWSRIPMLSDRTCQVLTSPLLPCDAAARFWEVSLYYGVQEVRKEGAVWDCQERLLKRPRETRGGARRRQRDRETEVRGARGGGQWGFWWGLSGEHMWVTAWINRLSLPYIDDLHTHTHTHAMLFMLPILPFTHSHSHITLKGGMSTHTHTHT